jgi:hypothetical protein
MHVVEATTIMKNDPPVGRSDVSECLPGWIWTMCDAFQKGEGYTLSHSAVSALAHTLICARVRAERLVRERDESRPDIKKIQDLECRLQHADSLVKRAYDGMHKEHWQEGESESEVCEGIRLYRDNYGAWIE